MKWETLSHKRSQAYGNRRVIKKFLYFPRRIYDEGRWLETVYIKQRYNGGWINDSWSNFEMWIQFEEKELNKLNELESQKEKKLAELKSYRKKEAIKAITELRDDEDIYEIFKEINSKSNVLRK